MLAELVVRIEDAVDGALMWWDKQTWYERLAWAAILAVIVCVIKVAQLLGVWGFLGRLL